MVSRACVGLFRMADPGQQELVGQRGIGARRHDIAGAEAELRRPPVHGNFHPSRSVGVEVGSSRFVDLLKELAQLTARLAGCVLVDDGVEVPAKVLPFLRSADDQLLLGIRRSAFRRKQRSRELLEGFLHVEARRGQVRHGDHGQRVVGQQGHGNGEFSGMEKLLGPGANDAAALDGSRDLRKVHDAQL